jgi:uncharacterized protein YdeI (YjbR/CyaY-like superfamily)
MGSRSPQVDAYIELAPEYARPILSTIREIVHRGCPEVQEVIKWGVPHFEHRGLLGGMAAFKRYAALGFWKGALMKDPHGLLGDDPKASMTGMRFARLEDLPPEKVLMAYVQEAARLNEQGVKLPRGPKSRKEEIPVPADFDQALAGNPRARETFEGFPPSHRREYLEWITEAKREETRRRRIATAVEWLVEGKPRNWKYMGKKG